MLFIKISKVAPSLAIATVLKPREHRGRHMRQFLLRASFRGTARASFHPLCSLRDDRIFSASGAELVFLSRHSYNAFIGKVSKSSAQKYVGSYLISALLEDALKFCNQSRSSTYLDFARVLQSSCKSLQTQVSYLKVINDRRPVGAGFVAGSSFISYKS